MRAGDLVDALRPIMPGALVASDFDGTLAPLVPDPSTSRPVDGAVDALIGLAGRGAHVAVITGREAATAVRLGGFADVPRMVVAGLYGLEIWRDGRLATPDEPSVLGVLRERLPGVLAGADPALWIEDKRLSLVVHARSAAVPDAALAAVGADVHRLADELGLETHPGAAVLEIRLPGFDKAAALHRLVGEVSPTAVLYLGDDLGDLPAFAAVRDLRAAGLTAYGVGVRSSGVAGLLEAADVLLPDPTAVVALLRSLG